MPRIKQVDELDPDVLSVQHLSGELGGRLREGEAVRDDDEADGGQRGQPRPDKADSAASRSSAVEVAPGS